MKTIWKYELKITDEQTISLPVNSKILSVQNFNGKLCLWAIVNSEDAEKERKIAIIGTGNPLWCNLKFWNFIDTVQMESGVWHVFSEY